MTAQRQSKPAISRDCAAESTDERQSIPADSGTLRPVRRYHLRYHKIDVYINPASKK
jgi:hypothetical protein